MQSIEKSKQKINSLLENYGPVGPRHLLAAALLMSRGKDENKTEEKKADDKVAA